MNLFFLLLHQQQQQPAAAASCHRGWKTIDRFEIVSIFYACCARRRGRQFTTLLSPAWPNKTMCVAVSCCRWVCDERPNRSDNNMCGSVYQQGSTRRMPKRRANTNTIKWVSTQLLFLLLFTHWQNSLEMNWNSYSPEELVFKGVYDNSIYLTTDAEYKLTSIFNRRCWSQCCSHNARTSFCIEYVRTYMTMTLTWWHRSWLLTDRSEQNADGKYTESPPFPFFHLPFFFNFKSRNQNAVCLCMRVLIEYNEEQYKEQSSRIPDQNKTAKRKRKHSRDWVTGHRFLEPHQAHCAYKSS